MQRWPNCWQSIRACWLGQIDMKIAYLTSELDLSAQNINDAGIGSGLSSSRIGLRLRYDIRREFAPYVGVQYRRAFGKTASYLRDDGEDAGGFQFLVGVRAWF